MSEFFQMGGYAFYVWTSYGITFLLLTINWVLPVMKRKALIKKLKRKQHLSD